ncbi:hypothetical protein [Mesorhizobium sp. M0800]|uniref:WD40/YVTN/BNR-like repeat-containing protein n=1 Tax=Mesorhizobium sp. M0800 TaxID=2957000 RepID=UPI0033385248
MTHENSGCEVHATCASVVESQHRKGEIWVSTDDGLVHVTRSDGAEWRNVTPEAMPELAYVGCVEISSHDADTVYVAATRYKLADYHPYLFRTRDGGKSWQSIVGDFPKGEITRVVRADPVRPGLLFVGTETGVFLSLDDGAHWSCMAGGLPVVAVYDLKIKGSDLVAGTHGRSLWILDDVTPLRELAVDQKDVLLVSPRPAIRTKLNYWAGIGSAKAGMSYCEDIGGGMEVVELEDGRRDCLHLDCGENPPNGAIVYYWLAKKAEEPVKLTFQDATGKTIVAFSSADKDAPFDKKPGTKAGLNRFLWDLRHPGPAKLDQSLVTLKYEPLVPGGSDSSGPAVVPGSYKVELQTNGKCQTVDLTVVKDPRLATTEKDFEEQFALIEQLVSKLSSLNQMVNRIRLLKRQLADIQKRLGSSDEWLVEGTQALFGRLEAIEGTLVDIKRETPRDVRNPVGLNETLIGLIDLVAIADAAPTVSARHGSTARSKNWTSSRRMTLMLSMSRSRAPASSCSGPGKA